MPIEQEQGWAAELLWTFWRKMSIGIFLAARTSSKCWESLTVKKNILGVFFFWMGHTEEQLVEVLRYQLEG